jgi:hypothetical protein
VLEYQGQEGKEVDFEGTSAVRDTVAHLDLVEVDDEEVGADAEGVVGVA